MVFKMHGPRSYLRLGTQELWELVNLESQHSEYGYFATEKEANEAQAYLLTTGAFQEESLYVLKRTPMTVEEFKKAHPQRNYGTTYEETEYEEKVNENPETYM
jgi:hypothetical protein